MWNGTAWTAMTTGQTANLGDVWGLAANDVYAVGDQGTVIRYDGTAWAKVVPVGAAPTRNLYAIRGSSANRPADLRALGNLLRYNVTTKTWTGVDTGTINNLTGLAVLSASDVWVVGQSGRLLHWNRRDLPGRQRHPQQLERHLGQQRHPADGGR